MIPAIYNYLATSYTPPKTSGPTAVHKRSELRNLYNDIVRMNKVSPLYKINLTGENQSFALGIKDNAIRLTETISQMDSTKDDSIFIHERAYSENEASADVILVDPDSEYLPEPFDLEVMSLATQQTNTSFSVPTDDLNPKEGTYSFMVSVDNSSYRLQYKIKPDATNEETMEKLAKFLNRSNLGIIATVRHPSETSVQMRIESEETGTTGEPIFTLRDLSSPEEFPGLVDYYGLDQISRASENAHFKINDEEKESLSNRILLDRVMQVDFLAPSQGSFKIDYMPDSNKILKELYGFKEDYNSIVNLANAYDSKQGLPQKLLAQLRSAVYPYSNDLEAAGISFDAKGSMVIDDSLASQAIETSEMNTLFTSKGFLPRLTKQLTSITMNPMAFVDKTLVSYPNLSKPGVTAVYASSRYSGMLFNYYC